MRIGDLAVEGDFRARFHLGPIDAVVRRNALGRHGGSREAGPPLDGAGRTSGTRIRDLFLEMVEEGTNVRA